MAGATNVFGDFEGYKIVNDEAVVAAAPEAVLAMQRSGLDLDAASVFGNAAFRETPAAVKNRFFSMEGLYMLGFGPRTARAARDLEPAALSRSQGVRRCRRTSRNAVIKPARNDLERITCRGCEVQQAAATLAGVDPAGTHLVRSDDIVGDGRSRRHTSGPAISRPLPVLARIRAFLSRDQLVLWSIRLPRIAATIMVGAMLASAGAIMQGLFRNPLADPSLVGVSSGAGFAAAATIVIGDKFLTAQIGQVPFEVLPLSAFLGALIATGVLYRLATHDLRTSIAIFLLGGLAIAALANAGIGLLVFVADDRQLRDVTFWLLGSMAGSTWLKVAADRTIPHRHCGGGAVDRARPRSSRSRRSGSVSRRRFRPAIEIGGHRHRCSRHWCCRVDFRSYRICRDRRAASAEAVDRTCAWSAAAGLDDAWSRASAVRGHGGSRSRRSGGGADRHHHRCHRRSILSGLAAATALDCDSMTALVEARDVVFRIGGRKILDSVDLSVEPGEIVALVGPNGAGKSTLLRLLSGELKPSSGSVAIRGRGIGTYTARELSQQRAVLSQHTSVSFPFTVAEIVRMGASPARPLPWVDNAIADVMAQSDILHLADQEVTRLSGGEQQRVHLARTLMQVESADDRYRPRLLLLDEPTSSLDLSHQLRVIDIVKSLAASGAGVVVIIHDLNLAAMLATRVVLMKRGSIVASGMPVQVICNEMVEAVFAVKTPLECCQKMPRPLCCPT